MKSSVSITMNLFFVNNVMEIEKSQVKWAL